jgi:hypothetical protein
MFIGNGYVEGHVRRPSSSSNAPCASFCRAAMPSHARDV